MNKDIKLYNYRITVSPWYPSYHIQRVEANTDKNWETVTNGASTRNVIHKSIIEELEDKS